MMIVCDGAATWISQSKSIPVPQSFINLGSGSIGFIPIPIIILTICAIVMNLILTKTIFGRWVYAVGINREAAKSAGVPTRFVLFMVHVVAAIMVALASIILTARLGTASLQMSSDGANMDIVCAAVVGGVSTFGGVGTILGALLGAVILTILQNFMNLFGINYYVTLIAKGLLLIACTYYDTVKTRTRRSAK